MIRRGTPEDIPWIVELGAEVYREFGAYEKILPSWLHHRGVLTYIEEDEAERRGFILLGFYPPEDGPGGRYIADVLAIAVAPTHQGKKLGRLLLELATDVARVSAGELRLTVAHTNDRARRLFESAGFEILDEDHGAYEGGQRAIRMRKVLI